MLMYEFMITRGSELHVGIKSARQHQVLVCFMIDLHTSCTENLLALFFISLKIEKIETRELLISTYLAKTLVSKLADTTSAVDQMFGNDLNISLRILNEILDYENSQTDMRNLTSEQDSKYLTVS